jgi:hypothetical protein
MSETTVFGVPNFVTKSPGEGETYSFDFTNRLNGSSVDSAAVAEKTTTALTIGTPTVTSPLVAVRISAGLVDNDYVVICTATLADGDTPQIYLTVRVRES